MAAAEGEKTENEIVYSSRGGVFTLDKWNQM